MKIKSGFVLHAMGQEYVVVAVDERTKVFCGMIRLNGTGAFLWKQLLRDCTEQDLAVALIEEYGITIELAREAVASFLNQVSGADVIES